MPKRIRKHILSHPDFPPVDWKPIARRFDIFFVDTTRVDPDNPFSKDYSAPNAPLLAIPCIHDLPKWEYPNCSACTLASIEFMLAKIDRSKAMRRAGLNPKPVLRAKGFKRAGALQMLRAKLNKYYEWKAAREREQEFPDQVAEERRKTKSKVLAVA